MLWRRWISFSHAAAHIRMQALEVLFLSFCHGRGVQGNVAGHVWRLADRPDSAVLVAASVHRLPFVCASQSDGGLTPSSLRSLEIRAESSSGPLEAIALGWVWTGEEGCGFVTS